MFVLAVYVKQINTLTFFEIDVNESKAAAFAFAASWVCDPSLPSPVRSGNYVAESRIFKKRTLYRKKSLVIRNIEQVSGKDNSFGKGKELLVHQFTLYYVIG